MCSVHPYGDTKRVWFGPYLALLSKSADKQEPLAPHCRREIEAQEVSVTCSWSRGHVPAPGPGSGGKSQLLEESSCPPWSGPSSSRARGQDTEQSQPRSGEGKSRVQHLPPGHCTEQPDVELDIQVPKRNSQQGHRNSCSQTSWAFHLCRLVWSQRKQSRDPSRSWWQHPPRARVVLAGDTSK